LTLRELISCNGFVAAIEAEVRATAEEQDGDWWIYGVNPGAIAEHGPSLNEALSTFRQRLTTVLIDSAAENAEFDALTEDLRQFFASTDTMSVDEWTEAREAVRRGEVDLAGVQRNTAEWSPHVHVAKVELTPRANILPPPASTIAA
jgi:hypothetical protein